MLTFCRLAWARTLRRTSVGYFSTSSDLVPSPAENFDLKPRSVLEPTDEDLSHIGRQVGPISGFSHYVNSSETLKNLIQLGVKLSVVERKSDLVIPILKLDFEKDVKCRLTFLNDYVDSDDLGEFITENPAFLLEDFDHMQTRVNYLESKKFSLERIKKIISGNPFWLMFSTKKIDERLGYFQSTFSLNGEEVRCLAVKKPRLITQKMNHIIVNTFAFKEEMGFTNEQMKEMILKDPRLWTRNQLSLIKRFNYLHSTMNMSHEAICKEVKVLDCRFVRLRERDGFLKRLGRNQYDPTKPNYVSLTKLVEGSDIDFCRDVAKCNVVDYNAYLKSQ